MNEDPCAAGLVHDDGWFCPRKFYHPRTVMEAAAWDLSRDEGVWTWERLSTTNDAGQHILKKIPVGMKIGEALIRAGSPPAEEADELVELLRAIESGAVMGALGDYPRDDEEEGEGP